MIFNENVSSSSYAFRIRLLECSKLTINWKNDIDVTILRHDFIITFFRPCFLSLVKFNYCSKVHVNIFTGSRVITVYFYKGLTRNPEIGNISVWVLPKIWSLEKVRDTKFGTDVSDKMLLNTTKYQGYSLCLSWVIKEKSRRGITHHSPRLGLK